MKKVTFEIKNNVYVIPEYLTIGDYVKIFKIKDLFDQDYFSAKLIHHLTGCPVDDLLTVNKKQIEYLTNTIMERFPKDNDTEFNDRFEIDGVKYGFIPSWKELTYGEWCDLDTLFSKSATEILDYIHIILSIMYRPIVKDKKKKYTIEDYSVDTMIERAELFREKLNIKYYFGSQFFFIKVARNYQSRTFQYLTNPTLTQQMKMVWKNRKEINKLLLKDGDGQSSQTELAEMILRNTKP